MAKAWGPKAWLEALTRQLGSQAGLWNTGRGGETAGDMGQSDAAGKGSEGYRQYSGPYLGTE